MRIFKKSNTIIDVIIAIMFVSTVLYFCYSLATSSINKRHQISRERNAMIVAENIMNRVISQGVYTIKNEPEITAEAKRELTKILNNNTLNEAQKNEKIQELKGRLPVNRYVDASFLQPGNPYSYQVSVDDYMAKTGVDNAGNPTYSRHTSLKKITVNVFYPVKVTKYLNRDSDITNEELANNTTHKKDKASLEEEYRVVTLSTYKSAREYQVSK